MSEKISIEDYYTIAETITHILMEHKKYGDEVPAIIVSKQSGKIVRTGVWNGFADLKY